MEKRPWYVRAISEANGDISSIRLAMVFGLGLVLFFVVICIFIPAMRELAGHIFGFAAITTGLKVAQKPLEEKTDKSASSEPPFQAPPPPPVAVPAPAPVNQTIIVPATPAPVPVAPELPVTPEPLFSPPAPRDRPIETIAGVAIFQSGRTITFTTGMEIDADGSPHAYHPDGRSGLDALNNAKNEKGDWVGVALDGYGRAFVQGANDPAPGYYVSTTTLEVAGKSRSDPNRYIDSEKVPFIVLPGGAFERWGIPLGALARVTNLANGKMADAVFADVGPRHKIGEGSIALAKALGIPSNARTGGTGRPIIHYEVTGDHQADVDKLRIA